MQKLSLILLSASLSFFSHTAHARGDGALWVFFVGPMCLSQYPEYANTELGTLLLRGASIEDYAARPFAQCIKTHQWASRELCEELMNMPAKQANAAALVRERHQAEIQGMKQAFDYFDAYIETNPTSPQWPPACPALVK